MPDLRARIAALCVMSNDQAERALAESLEHAGDDELPVLCAAILERGPASSTGWYALVKCLNRLSFNMRRIVLTNKDIPPQTLAAAALARGETQTRINALTILDAQATTGLFAPCLALNLSHTSTSVREAAAAWLLRVSLRVWRKRQTLTAPEIADLDSATAAACLSYPDHRQDDILLSACLLSHVLGQNKAPHLHAWLADDTHPSHMACRGTLKRLNRSQLARTIFEWLGTTRLSPQALAHLNELARSESLLPQILKSSHLALLPTQRRRLAELSPRRTAISERKVTFTGSEKKSPLHTPALARWIRAIPMPLTERVQRLADAQTCPDIATRLAAVHHLGQIADSVQRATDTLAADSTSNEALTNALHAFCHDPEANVAELAFLHLRLNQCLGPSVSEAINRLRWDSCHPSVRRLASALTECHDFEILWSLWSDRSLSRDVRVMRCRALAPLSPEEVADGLRRRLAVHQPAASVIAALQLTSVLGLVPTFEPELLTLTQHEDARVLATTARLLAELAPTSPSCSQAITSLLQHHDPRVAANAIESLDVPLLTTPIVARLLVTTASSLDAHNRARANAISRLFAIEPRLASARLNTMLRDRRPAHRSSALWLLEQKPSATDCMTSLATLAADDPVPRIRRRARRVANRILASSPQPSLALIREELSP